MAPAVGTIFHRGSLSSHFRAESGMGLLGINRLMPDRGILAKLCGDTVR